MLNDVCDYHRYGMILLLMKIVVVAGKLS